MILTRVRSGMAQARRKGTHCGRPKKIFRRGLAVEMRDAGMSLRAIARELGVPVCTIHLSLSTGAGAIQKVS
jgi:DNA invertase Pin-like site-specific DNA recombinase